MALDKQKETQRMVLGSNRLALFATGSVLIASLITACGRLPNPLVQPATDPDSAAAVSEPSAATALATPDAGPAATPAKPRAAGSRTTPVTRGTLTDTLSADGIVTAPSQESLTFDVRRAIVDDIKVKAGDVVKGGDVLIDFNPGDLTHSLEAARQRLSTSQANLAQAQAQAESQQAAAVQRSEAEKRQQQQALLDAELALKRALENQARVKAGKSESEKFVAETSVSKYGEGPVRDAQRALELAQAGPTPDQIRAAQRDVENLQVVLSKAQGELDALTRGPDPAALRDAQAAVQRAETQLQVAQAAKIDPKAPDPNLAKLQHDAAVQDAQLTVQRAQAQLDKLKQPPAAVDVQAARARVDDAATNLEAGKKKLEALQAGPDQAAIDQAQSNLDAAQHALAEMQAGLDEVKSHPTPSELAVAEDQVRQAQTAVDNARRTLAQPLDVQLPDLTTLQQLVEQDQADVAAAEKAVDDSHLRAPFDGTVVSVRVKVGDAPAPSKSLIVLAKPGAPIVRVDVEEADAARLAVGQQATVQVGTDAAATPASAKVASMVPAAKDGTTGPAVTLKVDWPAGQVPKFGSPVPVTITLQQKQDVLMLPSNAVKQSGERSMVEVQDGGLRRVIEVKTGLKTATSVEILSGLTEGQLVVAGPA